MLSLVMLAGIGLAMFLPGVRHASVSTTGCSYDYEIHPFDDNRLTQLVFFNGITSRRMCRNDTKWYAEVRPFDGHLVSIVYEGTVTRDHQIWEARNGTFVPSDEQVTLEELSAFMESTKSNVRERTLENLLAHRDLHRRFNGQQN